MKQLELFPRNTFDMVYNEAMCAVKTLRKLLSEIKEALYICTFEEKQLYLTLKKRKEKNNAKL